ncbi:MAG: amidohydrolase [Alphaproteobacteria bacterium]|nr:amidohydrolase [Alphaproteobacteria bacterium]
MSEQMQVIRGGKLLDISKRSAEPADILIEGNRIKEIGAAGMAAPDGAKEVDASDRLLMPGLVNGHTHGNSTLAKGLGDRWTLELLLNSHPYTGAGFTQEDKYLAAKLAACEMVLGGCTACLDMFAEGPAPTRDGLEAAGQAYMDVGMRAVVAPMMSTRGLWKAIPGLYDILPDDARDMVDGMSPGPGDASVTVCRDALHNWPHDPARVKLALGPTIPHHCDEAFWKACRDLAREYDALMQTHLAESKVQALASQKLYGTTLAGYLDSLEVLGPNLVAAHAIWLTGDDLKLLADRGVSVSHNPMSNLRLGSGVAATVAMREAGVNVAIGTDTCTCADALNMFEATRLACTLSRVQGPDYEKWLESAQALEMATEAGAKALGWEGEIGRIAPGYKADIVMLDLGAVTYMPLNEPVNQIVFSEDRGGVRDVMIDGRMVVAGGEVTTVDMDKLRAEVEAAVARQQPARESVRPKMEALAAHVGPFCAGFASESYLVNRFVGG